MTLSIITLFPELYTPFLTTSLLKRAHDQKLVSFCLSTLFNYADNERIDAPSYGPGAGMLIRPDVVERAVEDIEQKHGPAYKIFFSPRGKQLDQDLLKKIYQESAKRKHIMLLPARYEGMDSRVEDYYADSIISVGDFVLMGGDLPAMMFIEGFLRLIPGVVGKQESVAHDSFMSPFVDYPEFAPPLTWKGKTVPDVVRSGNHQEINGWRTEQAVRETVSSHFDWLRKHELSDKQKEQVLHEIPTHYAVLMHSQVMAAEDREGTTSVTSLDIHDIARSARTYGLKNYFLVTPLQDEQKIINRLLDFWLSHEGGMYNKTRQEAIQAVQLHGTLDDVLEVIRKQEGKEPLIIGTSARMEEYKKHVNRVSYYDQGSIWSRNQPIVFIFGTGRGLARSVLDRCDYMLPPVEGLTRYNHLSVRSAAAIIFDRWFGLNYA